MAGEPLTPDEQARLQQALAIKQQAYATGQALSGDAFDMSRGAAQASRAPAPPPDEPTLNQAKNLAAAGVAPAEIADRLKIAPDAVDKALAPPPDQQPAAPDAPDGGLQVGAAAAAAPPPGVVVPGGWQRMARTGRLTLDDATKSRPQQVEDFANAAIDQREAGQLTSSQQQAAKLDEIAGNVGRMDRYVARQESNRAAALEQNQLRLEELTNKVTSAEDPSRAYVRQSTPAKLFAILGVALGGYSAAMKGGPNQALEAYERELDRELDAQKADVASRNSNLANQRGLLGVMKENFADQRQAEAAAKIAYMKRADLDIQALAAQSQSPEIQARANELRAGLQEKLGALGITFAKAQQGTLQERYRPTQVVGGPGSGAAPQGDPKLYVPTGPNSGYFAKSEKEAEEGRKLVYAQQTIVPKLDKLAKERGESNILERGANWLGVYKSDRMRDIDSTQSSLATDVRRVEGIKGFGPEVEQLAKGQAGDYAAVSPGANPEAAGRAFKQNVNTQAAAYERGQAGQGARQVMALDANGRPVAVALPQTTMAGPRADMPAGFKAVNGQQPVRFESPQRGAAPQLVVPAKGGKGKGKGHKQAPEGEPEEDDDE